MELFIYHLIIQFIIFIHLIIFIINLIIFIINLILLLIYDNINMIIIILT